MQQDRLQSVRDAIRDIPDFPKKGILFKDITPVLADGILFRNAIDLFLGALEGKAVDKIVCIDARGFLFGSAIAYRLGVGMVPVRKRGKLPYLTRSHAYALEYGEAEVEMHVDAIRAGEQVVLIDDLLATGGTSAAAVGLIRAAGGVVAGAYFLIELGFLNGRSQLSGVPVVSFVQY